MNESFNFEIVKLFKLLLFVIFFKEVFRGFFRGFFKMIIKVIKEYRWIILFYMGLVLLIMKYIDEPVVRFWQTKAFQNKIFYYPGVIGNLIGNGEYLFSFFIVIILIAKIYNKEKTRKKFTIALVNSIFAGIFNTIIKIIFTRSRPDIHNPNAFKYESYSLNFSENLKLLKGDHSMPSGHITVAMTLFITLSLFEENKIIKILYLLPPLVTFFARIYFSKHWVSDATVSVLISLIFSITIFRLNKRNI